MALFIKPNERVADVICQHTRDQNIIPIKIRIQDEDKVYQEYKIREYKCTKPGMGVYQMPNEVFATATRWCFECKIEVFGTLRRIYLFYDKEQNIWTVISK